MEKIQNEPLNRCEEVLAHEGVKGMHWYVRRYQPYPSGYDGEGKFVGKRAARKAAKAEKRQARHQAKTDTRIKNAVDTGDKKKLKKYKDDMSPDEYEKKYAETVKNGIDNAVKDRDKSALKKYKDDLNKRDYQHQKDRIDFKDAIDNDNSRKTKKLLSKVDPEDVAEATNLIRSRVALQDQKLSKIRQDSELMAKMDKLNSGLSKISKMSQNVSSITSSFMDVNKRLSENAKSQKEAQDAAEKKRIEKIIKSGDLDKIKANQSKMTNEQLKNAYDRIVQLGSEEDIRKAAPYMTSTQLASANTKLAQRDKLNEYKAKRENVRSGVQTVTSFLDTRGTTLYSDVDKNEDVQKVNRTIQRLMSSNDSTIGDAMESFQRYEMLNTGSRVWQTDGGFQIRHSDDISYEDVLAHHGTKGMHWYIRRFQPYPKGYRGEGKEVGQAKRVSRSDRKYQDYDVSYAKTGSQYRKKTKYTNIDGSLNEKGKLHAQKYISKQIEKNEKYYAKEIAKYEKKAEKYKDNPEMRKKFLDMAKDAARSRDSVNKSIKQMAIDEIMSNESIENAKMIKAIKTAAGVTVGAATGGVVLGAGLGLSSALGRTEALNEFKKMGQQFDINRPIDSVIEMTQTSPYAAKAEAAVENAIRTYSDARAYVLGISLDQAATRLNWANQQYGITDKYGKIVGGFGKSAMNEAGITPQTISDLNTLVTNTGKVSNSVINNPNTMKIIESSGTTLNTALANPQVVNTMTNLNSAIQTSGGNTATVNIPNTVAVDPKVLDTMNQIMSTQRKPNAAHDSITKYK